MIKFRTLVLGLAAVVALVVLTACGGGDDNKSGGILSGNNNGSSQSSSSGSSSSGSGSSSGSSSGSLDFAKAAKNLQDVKSFNFDISLKMNLGDLSSGSGSSFGSKSGDLDLSSLFALLGNVKATGSYVAPDSTTVTASLMGQQFSYVQIGNKSWTKQSNNGKWTQSDASSSPLGSLSPTDLSSSAGSIPPDAL